MNEYLLLFIVTVLATAMWPVNRYAMKLGARTEALGVVICSVCALGTYLLGLYSGQGLWIPTAIGFGIIMGVAYAIGFVLIIFHCLKIGPAGLTVTVNNLGLLWPVAISLIWFANGKLPGPLLISGFIATLLALLLIGFSSNDKSVTITKKWVKWALIGWVWSGISMGAQYLNSQYEPDGSYAFTVSFNVTSLVILLVIMAIRKSGALRSCEIKCGLLSGLFGIPQLPIALYLLADNRVPATVVFPITVAGPAVIMLLIGHFALKERLNLIGWVASFLGITGIILLNLK